MKNKEYKGRIIDAAKAFLILMQIKDGILLSIPMIPEKIWRKPDRVCEDRVVEIPGNKLTTMISI